MDPSDSSPVPPSSPHSSTADIYGDEAYPDVDGVSEWVSEWVRIADVYGDEADPDVDGVSEWVGEWVSECVRITGVYGDEADPGVEWVSEWVSVRVCVNLCERECERRMHEVQSMIAVDGVLPLWSVYRRIGLSVWAYTWECVSACAWLNPIPQVNIWARTCLTPDHVRV